MDRYTQIEVNCALSGYKLGLLEELNKIDKKYRSVEVTRALHDVLKVMANDVVENNEKKNE